MREKHLEDMLNSNYLYLKPKDKNILREVLLQQQDYKCACCGKDLENEKNSNRHIDHCHKEKIIRSVLCATCNLVIGKIERAGYNIEWVNKLALYLESENTNIIYPEKITQRRKTKKEEMKKIIDKNSWIIN